jgi:hypothetical protein
MASIPGFWDVGPHDPLPVEPTWNEFVQTVGGQLISNLLPKLPRAENADYVFLEAGVVAELKEITTEFSRSEAFNHGLGMLIQRATAECPSWRPGYLGGHGERPKWFNEELVRLFRPQISRILKKANRQLRASKQHFHIKTSTGVLVFVNDGFTMIGPDIVQALACNLLLHSYSSIDCFLYVTVNRYVAIVGSDVPRLVWAPIYSNRAPDSLVEFIDDLGDRWYQFLGTKIGPFTDRARTSDGTLLRGSMSIRLPESSPDGLPPGVAATRQR